MYRVGDLFLAGGVNGHVIYADYVDHGQTGVIGHTPSGIHRARILVDEIAGEDPAIQVLTEVIP